MTSLASAQHAKGHRKKSSAAAPIVIANCLFAFPRAGTSRKVRSVATSPVTPMMRLEDSISPATAIPAAKAPK